MSELLSVVDEYDTVIGVETKERIHERELFHRSVHLYLVNTDGALLVCQVAPGKNFEGLWNVSVSGHVRAGESYLDAVVRETKEEIGLQFRPDLFRLLGKIEARVDTGNEFAQFYRVVSNAPLRVDRSEIVDARFVEHQEIGEKRIEMFTPMFLESYRRYGHQV